MITAALPLLFAALAGPASARATVKSPSLTVYNLDSIPPYKTIMLSVEKDTIPQYGADVPEGFILKTGRETLKISGGDFRSRSIFAVAGFSVREFVFQGYSGDTLNLLAACESKPGQTIYKNIRIQKKFVSEAFRPDNADSMKKNKGNKEGMFAGNHFPVLPFVLSVLFIFLFWSYA